METVLLEPFITVNRAASHEGWPIEPAKSRHGIEIERNTKTPRYRHAALRGRRTKDVSDEGNGGTEPFREYPLEIDQLSRLNHSWKRNPS
jgi:hypothetical protein